MSASPVFDKADALSLNDNIDHSHDIAWDLSSEPEIGPSYQPWRAHWPPSEEVLSKLSPEERQAQPWIEWKRDPSKLNHKPWYFWVNAFDADVDIKCGPRPDPECKDGPDKDCEKCGGGPGFCVSALSRQSFRCHL